MHEASLSHCLSPPRVGPGPQAVSPLTVGSGVATWWLVHAPGGSRISRTVVLHSALLHAPMLGTHMSLRNASVRLQHGSCAAACCFRSTRTTLACVARECTPLGRGTRPETHSLLHP